MNPILILGLALLIAAIFIGYKLVGPGISDRADDSGFGEARQRVVDSTSDLIESRSGNNLQSKLEKSGSQLRSGEWVLGVVAATLVLASLGLVRGGWVVIAFMFVFVPIIAVLLLNRRIQKRQEAFADQLPDLLQMLSSSLRSGQSLPQSIAGIAPDMAAPAGDELRRVVIENRIGRDLIDSFRDLGARMDSIDFDWVVRAIEINYSTGGDLSVILRRLDATIRARNQVAGTVRALTAEGRISGIVLSALPPGVLLAVQVMNPEFLRPMFNTTIGLALLIIAGLQLVIGSIWLARMARFKF